MQDAQPHLRPRRLPHRAHSCGLSRNIGNRRELSFINFYRLLSVTVDPDVIQSVATRALHVAHIQLFLKHNIHALLQGLFYCYFFIPTQTLYFQL